MVNWAAKRTKNYGKFGRQLGRTAANPTYGNIALSAYRGVKALRALVNSETHYRNVFVSTATVANTAIITQLNDVVQGDTLNSRTGNSILMSGLRSTEVMSSAVTCTVREILFIDKQQISDTAPVVTDILQTSVPIAFYAQEFPGRFQILSDSFYTLDTAAKPVIARRRYKKLQKHAVYNGTAAADIQKNGVYKLIITSGICFFEGNYRLGFHDN